jgi:CheY-like chemotaxis protein
MDLQMPIMDGYAATRHIKQIKGDIPIIAMSANAFSEAKQRAIEAGIDDFLDKPIMIDKAVAKIADYLGASIVNDTSQESEPLITSQNSIPSLGTEGEILSLTVIDRSTQGDELLKQKLLARFNAQAQPMLKHAQAYLNDGDWEPLERELHSLKSMCGAIGGVKAQSALADFERRARERSLTGADIETATARIAELIEALRPYIKQERQPSNNLLDDGLSHEPIAMTLEQKQKLIELISNYDSEALDLTNELLSSTTKSGLKEVQQALEQYDFDTALERANHIKT